MSLSAELDTPALETGKKVPIGVLAATTIYKGGMVAKNLNGYAVPASSTATLVPYGRACSTVTNSGSSGSVAVEVETGVFGWAGHATHAPTIAHVGSTVYATADDGLISSVSSDGPPAGLLVKIQSGVYFVDMTAPTAAASISQDSDLVTLAASGGLALIGYGASTAAAAVGSLSTANTTLVGRADSASTAAVSLLSGVNALSVSHAATSAYITSAAASGGGALAFVDLNTALAKIAIDRAKLYSKRTATITATDLQGLSGGVKVHEFAIGAAPPSGHNLRSYRIIVSPAFTDGAAGMFTAKLGFSGGGGEIATAVDLSTEGAPRGTAGESNFLDCPLFALPLYLEITSLVDLNTATVGEVLVEYRTQDVDAV